MVYAMAIAIVVVAGGLIAADRPGKGDDRDDRGHRKFSFALWGDTPYSDQEKTTAIPALIHDINDSDVAFTVFEGDVGEIGRAHV